MANRILRAMTLPVVFALGLASLAGCQSSSAPPAPPSAPDVIITIPVPVRDKVVASAAADVMSARLRHLGHDTFSVATGDQMTFTVPGDPPPDVAKIRDSFGRHGSLAFLPLAGDAELPLDGAPAPAGIQPLFDPAGAVESASVVVDQAGSPALELALAPGAAAALADWSKTHIGDYLVMVLDGVVLASPLLQAEIPDGDVVIAFPTTQQRAPDLDVLAAVFESGPLPPEWP